jgi:hypothetical protein
MTTTGTLMSLPAVSTVSDQVVVDEGRVPAVAYPRGSFVPARLHLDSACALAFHE